MHNNGQIGGGFGFTVETRAVNDFIIINVIVNVVIVVYTL